MKIFTDITGVEKIIKKGSMNSELHQLSIELADYCNRMNMVMEVQWIPRAYNQEADALI